MHPQIEQWIIDNRDHHGFGNVICEDDLRKLLAGKVLCDAEPVAWLHIQGNHGKLSFWSQGCTEKPLYAAADMGKEGGE